MERKKNTVENRADIVSVQNIAVQDVLQEQSLQILYDTPEWRPLIPDHFKPVQLGHWATTLSSTKKQSILFASPNWKLSHTAKVVLQCVYPKDAALALKDPCFEMMTISQSDFLQCVGKGSKK
jgi:hypothetical protein